MSLTSTSCYARRRSALGLALALPVGGLLLGSAPSARAQAVVSASPDVTIALGAANVVTPDEAVAVDNQLGIVVLTDLGPIPTAADVIGYGEGLGGTKLMTFDTTVALSGGVVARSGDVVAWDGSVHSIVFDATTQAIPHGVQVDAVSLAASGALLLSFDTDVSLPGGLTVADEDLVRWNGTSFSLVFDGSAAGIDRALDVDAADDLGSGSFLMSFETAGSLGGVVFQDEDVMRYAGGVWSLEVDGSALDADWAAADLVAVQVPEPRGGMVLVVSALALFLVRSVARGRVERFSAGGTAMERSRIVSLVLFVSCLLIAGFSSRAALASDGVLEINQTCAVNTGCFAGDTAGYPVTITASGSYRLTSNLVVPNENTSGIQFGASDVGIDLNNFTITRDACVGAVTNCTPASGTGSGVERTAGTSRGASVRNGSIIGMGSYGVIIGEQSEVMNVRARWNRITGIYVGTASTLWGNTTYQNGGDGMFGSPGSTITSNTSYSNLSDGIETSSGCTVVGNSVRANTGFGLNLGTQSGYRENVISGNTAGTVMGATAVNLGNNACNGATTCP